MMATRLPHCHGQTARQPQHQHPYRTAPTEAAEQIKVLLLLIMPLA
jgi:hypothetical protein